MKTIKISELGPTLNGACPCQVTIETSESICMNMLLNKVTFKPRNVAGSESRSFTAIFTADPSIPFIEGACVVHLPDECKTESLWISRSLSSDPTVAAFQLIFS